MGYCDFQFTFWILLCLWLLRGETTRDYLLAGLPLALAFLMKPQALILIVATFAYALFRYLELATGVLCCDARSPPTLLFLG